MFKVVCTEQGKILLGDLRREVTPKGPRSPPGNHSQIHMNQSQLSFSVSREDYNKKALRNYFSTTMRFPELEEKHNNNYLKRKIEQSKQELKTHMNYTPTHKKSDEMQPINESFLPTFRKRFNVKELHFYQDMQNKQKSNLLSIYHDEFMQENHNRIRLNESKIERLVERYRFYLNKDKETKATLDYNALVERTHKDTAKGSNNVLHIRNPSKQLITPEVESIMKRKNGEDDRYKERIERIHRIKYGKAWKDGYVPSRKEMKYNKSSIELIKTVD